MDPLLCVARLLWQASPLISDRVGDGIAGWAKALWVGEGIAFAHPQCPHLL